MKAIGWEENEEGRKQAYENILADPDVTDKKRHSTQLRLNTALTDIKTLKPKMNESKTDI